MKVIRTTLVSILIFGVLSVFTWLILPASVKSSVVDSLKVVAALANSRAIDAFKAQDLATATAALSEGLAASPEDSRLHFNLGFAWQLMKRAEDAVKSYKQVLKSEDSTNNEKFMSHFNMGVMNQGAKEVDKALVDYQAALDLNPDSRETKINIELLIQNGGGGGGKGEQENKDQQKEGEGQGDKEKEQQPKEYAPNKPQKPQFKSEELTPSDVNKILGELKQQEQRIRSEYNRREGKEPARGKDW